MVDVVEEDYLMEVKVVEGDCLMNDSARFDAYHRLGLDRRS